MHKLSGFFCNDERCVLKFHISNCNFASLYYEVFCRELVKFHDIPCVRLVPAVVSSQLRCQNDR